MTGTARETGRIAGIGGGLVGFLVFVEFTSGVLQGYYIPLLTDVARHLDIHDADVNWLEAAQLMLAAIAVPILAKLGDLHGHRRMLLGSAAVVAAGTVVLAFAQNFTVFLIAWAVLDFFVSGLVDAALLTRMTDSTVILSGDVPWLPVLVGVTLLALARVIAQAVDLRRDAEATI